MIWYWYRLLDKITFKIKIATFLVLQLQGGGHREGGKRMAMAGVEITVVTQLK